MSRRAKARPTASATLQHLLGIEILLVAVAVTMALAMMLEHVPALAGRARAVGAFMAIRPAQIEMTETIATRGELPSEPEPLLGLRPAAPVAEAGGTVLWLCGDRPPPPRFEALPAAPAAAASAARFSVCREGRRS